jgi:hypothetical protein
MPEIKDEGSSVFSLCLISRISGSGIKWIPIMPEIKDQESGIKWIPSMPEIKDPGSENIFFSVCRMNTRQNTYVCSCKRAPEEDPGQG